MYIIYHGKDYQLGSKRSGFCKKKSTRVYYEVWDDVELEQLLQDPLAEGREQEQLEFLG